MLPGGRLRAGLAALLLLGGTPGVARPQSGGQIVERCGAALGLRLGAPSPGAIDSTVSVATDAGGNIRQITVRRAGAFTQRYIVIGESTLGDVLQRYGKPTNSTHAGSSLTVSYAYDGIDFVFPYGGSLQNNLPVRGAIVRAKQPLPSGGYYPCGVAKK